MGRGETRVSDNESVRREKTKGREKVKKLTMREKAPKKYVFYDYIRK